MLQSGCHGSPAREALRKVLTPEVAHWREAARFGEASGGLQGCDPAFVAGGVRELIDRANWAGL
jgi:hypothetical protein